MVYAIFACKYQTSRMTYDYSIEVNIAQRGMISPSLVLVLTPCCEKTLYLGVKFDISIVEVIPNKISRTLQ